MAPPFAWNGWEKNSPATYTLVCHHTHCATQFEPMFSSKRSKNILQHIILYECQGSSEQLQAMSRDNGRSCYGRPSLPCNAIVAAWFRGSEVRSFTFPFSFFLLSSLHFSFCFVLFCQWFIYNALIANCKNTVKSIVVEKKKSKPQNNEHFQCTEWRAVVEVGAGVGGWYTYNVVLKKEAKRMRKSTQPH